MRVSPQWVLDREQIVAALVEQQLGGLRLGVEQVQGHHLAI